MADNFRQVGCLNVYGRKRGRQTTHAFLPLLSLFKTFVKFVVRRTMFANQAEKIASYVGLTLKLKRGLSQTMLRCLFLRGCCGILFM